jgi:protein-S-isoprenylcysteine O-methyltransferase Ste14
MLAGNNDISKILHGISGLGVIVVSLFINLRINELVYEIKSIGWVLLVTGLIVFGWAFIFIKHAILGLDNSESNILITNGPYKFVRHPIYLGMIISLSGVALILRSWPGIIIVLIIFIPSVIYRIKNEENYLLERYKEQWREYYNNTPAFIPFFKK